MQNVMGLGLRVLNRFASLPIVDQLGLRKSTERWLYQASKTGFQAATFAGRQFKATQKLLKPARLERSSRPELFDLMPSDDQSMLREAAQNFALEQLRGAAQKADFDCKAAPELLAAASELGVGILGVPEELGGAGSERSVMTNVLVAEALALGDLGLAVACLAPNAVSTALVLWGDEQQQATYLPAFVGEHPPVAALAVMEPKPLFDAQILSTKAARVEGGFVLNGLKSLVPRAAEAELFIIAADLEGQPALFIIESKTAGLSVEAEPAMGLRAASTAQLQLVDVKLAANALIGEGASAIYDECIALSRLAWCALAVGTGQAVLDYLIPYVNDRVAFGEPISHRQAVAFSVANVGIELEGMRLLTLRAASRADQGQDYFRQVALARRMCADKGVAIGSDGVQLLGGHGFIKEHPVERWYRDLRAAGMMEGVLLV
jgi:alkylation response protein AidB-like acyl-CoA dehydrogenase